MLSCMKNSFSEEGTLALTSEAGAGVRGHSTGTGQGWAGHGCGELHQVRGLILQRFCSQGR